MLRFHDTLPRRRDVQRVQRRTLEFRERRDLGPDHFQYGRFDKRGRRGPFDYVGSLGAIRYPNGSGFVRRLRRRLADIYAE